MSDLRAATESTIAEGERRLNRTWPMLLATGLVGGIDIGVGVLASLLVLEATGSHLLAGLAFGIGFIALSLANSELFTENFLVPVAAVAARRASVGAVLRLWLGTLVMNLAGGWLITLLIVMALPQVASVAREVGGHFVEIGFGWRSLASAIVAGAIITLMTWMERSTDSVPGRLIAAVSIAFLLGGASLNHAVVMSLDMFSALHVGADFGYLDWVRALGWASLGNMVGGLGLVTMLRITQMKSEVGITGEDEARHERRREGGDAAHERHGGGEDAPHGAPGGGERSREQARAET